LFHDSGYIRHEERDKDFSNGAEFTLYHVSRSADFLRRYLPGLGLMKDVAVSSMIVHFTGYELDLDKIDILLVENVGNLVCPAEFDVGVDAKVMLLSITEGDDKPKKYPLMFHESDLLILNKIDLAPHVDFNNEKAKAEARDINPSIDIIELSCRTGEGLQSWVDWMIRLCEERMG
jgi:hydrogenase accessory protein HypB